jgi:thiosulfate reductase cytochrome b subunit
MELPRHSAIVRVTHWITVVSFLGLVVSGVAILIAHPRLYWGETGSVGTPSLVDLPLPFVFVGQTGWGRSLHFLSAWICVLTGFIYVASGLFSEHFRRDMLPTKAEVAWTSLSRVMSHHVHVHRLTEEGTLRYNVLQRLTYLCVIFVLFPLIILTGLAMSPAITSVSHALVNIFGGQQSARTIHFFTAALVVLFFFIHVTMVCLTGFANRMRSMITGHTGHVSARRESS